MSWKPPDKHYSLKTQLSQFEIADGGRFDGAQLSQFGMKGPTVSDFENLYTGQTDKMNTIQYRL